MKQMVLISVTKKVTGIRNCLHEYRAAIFNCSKSGENIFIHEESIRNVLTELSVLEDALFQEKVSVVHYFITEKPNF